MIHLMRDDGDFGGIETVQFPAFYTHIASTPAALSESHRMGGIQEAHSPVPLSHVDSFVLKSAEDIR